MDLTGDYRDSAPAGHLGDLGGIALWLGYFLIFRIFFSKIIKARTISAVYGWKIEVL